MGLTRETFAVLAACLALTLTGCGDDDPVEPSPDPRAAWPTTSTPLDRTQLTWALGSVVHLGDRTFDAGSDVATFVVAGDGVFFTRDQDEPGPGSYSGDPDESDRPLYFTDGTGRPRQVARSAATLRVSPDGRFLAYLDLETGPKDGVGTAQIQTVVVDLRTGKDVVRSTEGMGDPDEDDLGAVYPESPPRVLILDATTAYVKPFRGDVLAFDLATGEATTSDQPVSDFDLPPLDDRQNPSGQWRIVDTDRFHDTLVSAEQTVTPTGVPGPLDLRYWLDDRTAVGIALEPPGSPLVTCVVPTGRCAEVRGSAGEVVFPSGLLDY